jgi:predicted ABC-type ATPase
MISEMRHYARRGESFAIETTLAGRRYERMIAEWQSLGYHVHLIYLRLSSPELAISRVSVRVKQGGHHVDESTILRRYAEGWSNVESVIGQLVDSWELYDNSGEAIVLLEEGAN